MAEDTRQSGSTSPPQPIIAGYKPPDPERDDQYLPKNKASSSSTTSFKKLRDDLGLSESQRQDASDKSLPIAPPQNANAFPGGTAHTAGGEKLENQSLYMKALQTIPLGELKNVHKQPCARDGFMMGLYGGFAAGGVAWIAHRPVWSICNWASVTFCVAAFGAHEICMYKRKVELSGVAQMHAIMAEKNEEKKQKKEALINARKQKKLAEEEAYRNKYFWRRWNRGLREG